ncbi:hypothetical protein JD844_016946 [Phrynosoma platyrhinos]|uniref:Uncharacterized protein n=1 Tax=Phrynosoma platyrhinos TaxID=52577 RepID=A0ABQ7SL02_PHRPL|nr:hypothetical protein JD844_016946 [Phrynosoma platyrhinos]
MLPSAADTQLSQRSGPGSPVGFQRMCGQDSLARGPHVRESSTSALSSLSCSEGYSEICHLLRHVSGTEPLEITCLHAEETFQVTGPQIISAAETLTLYPSSKIAKENLDVFCEAWESQLSDMSLLLREISDVFEGRRGEKRAYLSLPRPGKHNSNLKALKPVRLDSEEQTKLGKLGLELHKLAICVDSEMDKWEDPENEIARHAQGLSSMAYSMYLFTRTLLPNVAYAISELVNMVMVKEEGALQVAGCPIYVNDRSISRQNAADVADSLVEYAMTLNGQGTLATLYVFGVHAFIQVDIVEQATLHSNHIDKKT